MEQKIPFVSLAATGRFTVSQLKVLKEREVLRLNK